MHFGKLFMHPFSYEPGIIVQNSRRLSWGENGHEGQDELSNVFICGIAHLFAPFRENGKNIWRGMCRNVLLLYNENLEYLG